MDPLVELTGQEQAIDVAGEVTFHGQVAGRETGRMTEGQHGPIAEQDAGKPDPETLRGLIVEYKDELREHARETDASEYAAQTHVLEPLPLESVVIDDAEQDEDEASLDDLADDFAASAFREPARQRIRRGDAGHEKEQREDEVVSLEAVPLDVLQLGVDRAEPTPLGQFEEREQDAMSADDPEEVEAAQGIE